MKRHINDVAGSAIIEEKSYVSQKQSVRPTAAVGGTAAPPLASLQPLSIIGASAFVTNSYIEGDVDFMWGTGSAFFQDSEFTALQLERFRPFVEELRSRSPGLVAHAANSAATLREPASHFDLVRCGIAIYGCDPMNEDPTMHELEPALELSSYLAAVKLARPGDSAGYGRRFIAERETWVGTLPIGYGDGFRRALSNNCDVLVRGHRYPLVGTVSMDNITVDLGTQTDAAVGDVAVLIGRDGDQRQTAEALAQRIGTINYEVVCGISGRVPRVYHRDGAPA